MAAQTLVIVADQSGVAIRTYRSVGFRDAETQVQAQRRSSDQGRKDCGRGAPRPA